MIYDRLENVGTYFEKESLLYKAVCFARDEAAGLSVGVHKLDGERLKANIDEYQTQPADERRFEAHEQYMDVQVMLDGVERQDISVSTDLVPAVPYSLEKDIVFFQTPETFATVRLEPGTFVVYFPQDAHRPSCAADGVPASVRKVCMKIKV